jgi:hypothetical protein
MQKKIYITPQVEIIQFDNEISLALQSVPEAGPEEGLLNMPDSKNNNPFNNSYLV